MKAYELRSGTGIKPLKLSVRETSHLVIEPTMQCNLPCRICYNLDLVFARNHHLSREPGLDPGVNETLCEVPVPRRH